MTHAFVTEKMRAEARAILLDHLTKIAKRKERAPTTEQIREFVQKNCPCSTTTNDLAAAKLIRSYVYARNFRVIEIVETGDRTQEPPPSYALYRIVDQHGSRIIKI